MNRDAMVFPWEDAIRAAVRVRDADSGFARRLREDLLRKAAVERPIHRKPAVRPVWVAFMAVIAVLLGALLVIGPEKVVAALQSLFGYLPDAGFVRMDRPFRILEKQIKEERSGAALYIRQVLADDRRTVVVYEVDCPGPETQWLKTSTFCADAPGLLLPGGGRLEPAGRFGRSDLPYYRERAEFPALPPSVTSVTFLLPFRPAPGEPATPWAVELALTPTAREATIYPVLENIPTGSPRADGATPEPLPDGIRFSLDRIVAMEEVYFLQGSLEWDPARYLSADVDYRLLEILDGTGGSCPWEFAVPDSPAAGSEHRIPWAVRFNPRGRPGPFRIRVRSLRVVESVNASFLMDFGSAPHAGQTWMLDFPLPVAGLDLRVTSARIEQEDESLLVFFSFAGTGNIIGATWMDAVQTTQTIEGGGLERSGIFESGSRYEYMPTGPHTIRVISITRQLEGDWIIPFDVFF
ncbi:MAG: hypothetical protein WBM17_12960 [Anaerolineales bacterium]